MHVVKISDLKNLFPSKLHAVIFVAYMGLFINQGKWNDAMGAGLNGIRSPHLTISSDLRWQLITAKLVANK